MSALDHRLKRLNPALLPTTSDSATTPGAALPVGALKKMEGAYARFWARRGKQPPSEKWSSRSTARGERGPA